MDSSYPANGQKNFSLMGYYGLSPLGILKISKEVIRILNAALSPQTLHLEL